MSTGHARLAPSNTRWPVCPGSVREEEQYPDVPGEAAIDGTGSHLLLEMCLENNVRAEAYDGQIIGVNHEDNPNGWLVGSDRILRVQQCLDYISRRVKELREIYSGSKVVVEAESKSDPGGMFGRNDWYGTVDVTITVLNNHSACLFLEVIDYKDGRGWVSEKGNSQLTSYLAGKARPYIASGPEHVRPFKPERVGGYRVTIVQPKTSPPVRYDEPAGSDLIDELDRLGRAASRTDNPVAPLVSDGDGKGHCRWCKHKPNCPELNGTGIEAIKTMTTTVLQTTSGELFTGLANAVTDVAAFSNEQLSQLCETEAHVQAIYDKMKAEIQRRIELGHDVPGYAIEPGRGSNVWNTSEEEIAKMLKARRLKRDDIYPPKLLSPAAVLKLEQLDEKQKERIQKDYITYKVGKPTLKKVSHKKKLANDGDVVDMFANVKSIFDQPEEQEVAPAATPVSFL